MKDGEELNDWNIYSPLWCRVGVENYKNQKALALHDSDPFDYAKAERVFPELKEMTAQFTITPMQDQFGLLDIEILDSKGTACLRITLDSSGNILTKQGYRNKSIGKYKTGEALTIKVMLDVVTRFYLVQINFKAGINNLCFAPVKSVERIVFRTGNIRRFPDADTPTDQDYDLPDANKKDKEAIYYIHDLRVGKTKPVRI